MLHDWSEEDADRRSLVAAALAQDRDGIRLAQVVKRLVGERVPVRRLDAILGAFVAAMRGTAETWEIVEAVRRVAVARAARERDGNAGCSP